MSNHLTMRSKKRLKSKNIINVDKDIDPINPDILNYIQKVQNDKEKVKVMHQSIKNQMPMPTQVEFLSNKLINIKVQPNLNEDITHEKNIRLAAKKGLLFLLNNLSKGTFCPDIDDYFINMKEAKIEELRKKSKLKEYNGISDNENLKEDKIKQFNLIKKIPNKENNIDNYKENNIGENIKFINKNENNEKNSEINHKLGLKKYNNDYDAEDLINFYDKNQIKNNTFQINYSKEKKYKMKLKMKNK